ncbi:hypothetical protein GRF61_05345 [Azoarcus sp. TTM-91]|uniref:glycosyltransferase n=1 Tax=Azoarcus sp. TTM-91 TaxID=2691581 RepID=UPI00145FB26E|nr:hypothetical protein [Azoarcus sp. TTM-91]NMG33875.1 hypothetical protein [Azoarcus sp. TTM-91]
MLTKRQAVLIYNPVSGHGHLDSWNAMFVALMLEKGWKVLALTPDTGALMERLDQKGLANSPGLQLLDWNAHQPRMRTYLRGAWQRWDRLGDRYFYHRAGSETTSGLSFGEYWKRRMCQAVVPFLFRASYYAYTRYRRRYLTSHSLAVEDPESYMACPVDMARRVHAALRKARAKPALVFNMYMDTYRTSRPRWDEFAAINTLRWAGIRFVPPAMPEEPWYQLPSWRGMCILDERVRAAYSNELPDKVFGYLPDITETALPTDSTVFVREIHRRARGRKIVFLGGSIGGQKNLARWFELIRLADPGRWFFVQVGEIHRGTLTVEDVAALDAALAAPPENLLLHAEYLPDERVFNEVISTCDVVFAVYRRFSISSNMPGKAAHFRKPVLVSDRYLLGERVTRYGIGLGVDEDDAHAMLAGLACVMDKPVPEACFSRYCSDFSLTELAGRLEGFLHDCLK